MRKTTLKAVVGSYKQLGTVLRKLSDSFVVKLILV